MNKVVWIFSMNLEDRYKKYFGIFLQEIGITKSSPKESNNGLRSWFYRLTIICQKYSVDTNKWIFTFLGHPAMSTAEN